MISLLISTSCSLEPLRAYNQDDLQDDVCYKRYGGVYGYCDKPLNRLKE